MENKKRNQGEKIRSLCVYNLILELDKNSKGSD